MVRLPKLTSRIEGQERASTAAAYGGRASPWRRPVSLAWANVEAQLRAADMELTNLIKVTIFLSNREFAVENRAVRQEILGLHSPALTVIIAGIFDEAWLLEIEAIAAA